MITENEKDSLRADIRFMKKMIERERVKITESEKSIAEWELKIRAWECFLDSSS